MYRKVKCKLTEFVDLGEVVPSVSTEEREDGTYQIVSDRVLKMDERAKTHLNPKIVTADALISSGQIIEGTAEIGVTDPADIGERAAAVAQVISTKIPTEV